METTTSFFIRVIAKIHQHISQTNISLFAEDFSGLLRPIDPDLKAIIREVAEGVARLYIQKTLGTFIIEYETIATCMRFRGDKSLAGVSTRLISSSISEIPQSDGNPTFIVGLKNESFRFNWLEIDRGDTQAQWEIFPLIDFENLCFFYARRETPHNSFALNSPTKVPSSDSSQLSMPLSQRQIMTGFSSSDGEGES